MYSKGWLFTFAEAPARAPRRVERGITLTSVLSRQGRGGKRATAGGRAPRYARLRAAAKQCGNSRRRSVDATVRPAGPQSHGAGRCVRALRAAARPGAISVHWRRTAGERRRRSGEDPSSGGPPFARRGRAVAELDSSPQVVGASRRLRPGGCPGGTRRSGLGGRGPVSESGIRDRGRSTRDGVDTRALRGLRASGRHTSRSRRVLSRRGAHRAAAERRAHRRRRAALDDASGIAVTLTPALSRRGRGDSQIPHLRHSRERGNPSPTRCAAMTPEAVRHAGRPNQVGNLGTPNRLPRGPYPG